MTSLMSLKRRVTRLENDLTPKPEDVVLFRLWLPSNDPLHKMTDEEIIQKGYQENRKIICLPLRESE